MRRDISAAREKRALPFWPGAALDHSPAAAYQTLLDRVGRFRQFAKRNISAAGERLTRLAGRFSRSIFSSCTAPPFSRLSSVRQHHLPWRAGLDRHRADQGTFTPPQLTDPYMLAYLRGGEKQRSSEWRFRSSTAVLLSVGEDWLRANSRTAKFARRPIEGHGGFSTRDLSQLFQGSAKRMRLLRGMEFISRQLGLLVPKAAVPAVCLPVGFGIFVLISVSLVREYCLGAEPPQCGILDLLDYSVLHQPGQRCRRHRTMQGDKGLKGICAHCFPA